jgi:hypothetical protein
MGRALAVGVPAWADRSAAWDPTPLVAAVCILLVSRALLGRRVNAATAAAAAVGGALFASLSRAWGLALPTFLALLIVVVVGRIARERGA